ncbi:circadian clock protein KaiC [Anaerospora hongkongensis]|uniref:circadian clock protein KaiC n=1 Tax=Anaerospora hongkongensis TaxID=244830 RepID=UPI0028984A8E|nr:circadian clock protein KaiC [Anaerospora hongkongensis]
MTILHKAYPAQILKKCPTGIQGLDDITFGGLPLGRTALVCGAAGCGKTLLAMQFLVNGAQLYNEPGIFMSFEENETELAENFASLGVDLNELTAQNKINLDYVHLDKNEIAEAGDYDLDGLFIRLDYAIQSIGAKRVVLDTIEALFSGLSNTTILRAELRRLFRWLKERGVTAIVTGERGNGTLTRHGIEEYVSDCVILLEHRVVDQISTRRLRIAKYRGSAHGTNEYPFLIDEQGICLMPITSVGLNAQASMERISSGIERLDTMLGGHGFYVGSSILISGTAGTGKTSLAASTADAACRQGKRCLYFAFEESRSQIVRNMKSVGIDLNQWLDQGLLEIHASRPTLFGLEMHLVNMYKKVTECKPQLVILDPISNLTAAGNCSDVKLMLTRMLDFLKLQNITALFLDLSNFNQTNHTDIAISSLTDTWIALQNIENNGERNRGLYLLKSRGMAHSNQIREFVLTDRGIELLDVYTGPEGVLTGSARYAQEEKELAQRLLREQEIERKRREIERKHQQLTTTIASLQADFESEKMELEKIMALEGAHLTALDSNRLHLAKLRNADD